MLVRLYPLVALTICWSIAQEPLPNCRYDDVATAHQSYQDWAITLLDTIYAVDPSYMPPDLVSVSEIGLTGDFRLRQVLLADLEALMAAAASAGHPLAIQSAFRSYDYQQRTFQYWVDRDGYEYALRSSARAGHSEHQLGTAIDFRSQDGPAPWDVSDWALTPAGGWMAEHAWQYGFVMSYPKDREQDTCYIYEPWHYRYVGKSTAKDIKQRETTLRAWLWTRQ
ncbi:MAG: M15 family metallopeptidase [Trueperaceae bacterium]|nr:MAG: M15 family metallopeptidase [Trueperaceae bacterium]